MNLIKIIKQCLCGHDWVARIKESKQKWQPDTHWRVIAAEYRCAKCGKTRPMDGEEAHSLVVILGQEGAAALLRGRPHITGWEVSTVEVEVEKEASE